MGVYILSELESVLNPWKTSKILELFTKFSPSYFSLVWKRGKNNKQIYIYMYLTLSCQLHVVVPLPHPLPFHYPDWSVSFFAKYWEKCKFCMCCDINIILYIIYIVYILIYCYLLHLHSKYLGCQNLMRTPSSHFVQCLWTKNKFPSLSPLYLVLCDLNIIEICLFTLYKFSDMS